MDFPPLLRFINLAVTRAVPICSSFYSSYFVVSNICVMDYFLLLMFVPAMTSTTATSTAATTAMINTTAASSTVTTAMTSTTTNTTVTSTTATTGMNSTTATSTTVTTAMTSATATSTTATTAMTSTTATSTTATTAMTSTTATSTTATTAMTSATATSTTATTAMTSTTATSTTATTAMTSTTATSTTATTAMTSTTATSTTATTAMTSTTATSATATTAMTSTTATSTTVTTAMTSATATSTTVTTAMTSTTTTSTTTSTTVTSTTVKVATTSTTFSTAVTSPNLVCENSGTLQKGICLCPDGWTGITCNIPNFCPGQTFPTPNAFTFPKTVLGQFASSVEQCPSNTPNAGIPQASAFCNINTRTFDSPNKVKCNLTLDTINADVSGANLNVKKSLASSTQILTSIPERLTSQNITNAVKIAHFLLSNQQTTNQNDIVVSAVATVSQLLSTREEIFSSVDRSAVSQLTQTLQEISLSENSNPLLVQPNIAMQSLKGQTPIRQVQLTFFKDFNKDIGFVLYDNDRFFQSNSFQPTLDTKRRVISANLPEITQLDQIKFIVTESTDSTMSLNDFACVFWSYSKNDWSPDGCSKTTGPSGQAECSCIPKTVKTNFAILMSFNINYQYSEALSWISIIGCALSVVGLSVTAVYQIITRKSRGINPTLLVVNVCMSMMVFYLLFIFGINNPVKHLTVAKSSQNIVPASDYHTYPDQGPCTVYTALLQFFLLATFTWNTLYGVNVFLLFKNHVSGTPAWFPKVALPVGWGVPAVIVGISLGTTYSVKEPLGYRQEEFCWLAALDHNLNFSMGKPMFWGFVLPLLLMLISNAAILLHFSHNICKTNPNLNRSRTTPLKNKILSSFSLAVMLGLSWAIGYILLIIRDSYLQFLLTVVFCVLNTTQGVQILILFTLRPVLNSHPGFLAALRPSTITFHMRTFYLWKNKTPDSHESYTSTAPNSV
ncbi:adhesion G-protein coupled receptor G7 [Danio aesculapii]|uniref:adhesion G-protein coupled receptor G7 n=1 Tax=Danio aesculapii TaxID=1142201 RepID=UPI0024C02E5A|nr:adhesion G-protein coupled receptor G7 [Danio aesculapii]